LPSSMAPERILIVRVAALGDVARASSLLSRIRAERPGAHITWLCSNQSAALVRLFPGVDRIVDLDEHRLFSGKFAVQAVEVARTWLRLAGGRFDLALLGHPDPRYRRLIQPVPAHRIRTLAAPSRESRQFIGDEFASLLDGHSVPEGQFPVADLRPTVVNVSLPPDFVHLVQRDNLVLLVPGGAKNSLRDDPLRRWPLPAYVELARRLTQEGMTVALIGGKSDEWVRTPFAELPVVDLIGHLNIAQTLRVMHAASVVVSHDTGPLHLAHLVRARIVALFGPTVPQRVLGNHSSIHVLWGGADLPCRPCYDGRNYAPCTSNLCMQRISVDDALDAVSGFLTSGRPAP
jgi:heptosyltransferase II